MRLADDTRGRVPFALIGVLLLLGSTTYATTLATEGVTVDRDVEVAMDRATAATETALRAAVARAARDAARTPVVTPADSAWGDVLNGSRPFRDSLRVRILVAARAGFERASYTHGDVTAAASLPATPTPAALDRTLDRITVVGVENGTALRVTVRDLSVVARQDGRVVARENTTRTVTVATPVLALHDRTVRFERTLDRGPLDGRGLGRRLTARLYPLAWARGYAQWGGLPISNVVGTRHVGVAANGAVLELQQEAYGRSDPTGRAAHRRALLRLGKQELEAGVQSPAAALAASVASDPSVLDPDAAPERVPRLAPADSPSPERRLGVGVNDTADRAFVSLHHEDAVSSFNDSHSSDGKPPLDTVLERAYQVDLRLRTTATLVHSDPRPPGPPDASLVNESVRHDVTVRPGSATLPSVEPGWTRLRTATRSVTVEHHIERTWTRDNTTIRTSTTVNETHAVGVAVDGRPARLNGTLNRTPTRPIVPVFERGGALDGPNLADMHNESDSFLADRGGVEGVVTRRLLDGPDALDRNGTVSGDRPDGLDEWVAADLMRLRSQVRNVSVTVQASDVVSGTANPPARLRAALDDRRAGFVDAPAQYDGVADRARVAARVAYLDRVRARLGSRANATRRANERLVTRLRDEGIDLVGRSADVLTNRTARPAEPPARRGPLGGEDLFVPQGGPAYLDVQGVDTTDASWSDGGGTAYPLETRNLNVFTVPYGDTADAVVGTVMGDDETGTVRLRSAAVTLRAAEAAAGPDTPEVRQRRDRLERDVSDALSVVGSRTRHVLARETSLSMAERHRVVDAAFSRWNRTSARAIAVTDGSFVPAVVDAADVDGSTADRLRVSLRAAVAAARDSPGTRVEHRRVNSTANAVREVSRTVATEALGTVAANGTERLATRTKGRAVVLPAGLPLLPTPTNWYVTVNVWDVHVRGEYPRFAVRTSRGLPGETVTYVRDGGRAELDVDGDGNVETLGRADRIDFSVRTVVLVAVPPGKTGVGDVDGQAAEESPGWTD